MERRRVISIVGNMAHLIPLGSLATYATKYGNLSARYPSIGAALWRSAKGVFSRSLESTTGGKPAAVYDGGGYAVRPYGLRAV
jgi:hypothetical protein